jgi:hypothetical protein
MAKASDWNGFDGEGRKPGEQTGLDTRVVLAVNAASKALRILHECAVSKRRRLNLLDGLPSANSILKGIGGGALQGVRRAV